MSTPAVGRLPGARPLRIALVQLVTLAIVLGFVQLVLLVDSPAGPFGVLVLLTLTGWIYVGAGTFAWSRRPSNRMGPLLCGGGIAWLLAALVNTTYPAFVAVGEIVATVGVAVVVHALVAFPSGRLRDRVSRALVVAAYAASIVLNAPVHLFAGTETAAGANPLLIADRPDLVAVARTVITVAYAVVVAGTAAVLVARLRAAAPQARLVLAPLYVYGIVAVVTVWFAGSLLRFDGIDPLAVFLAQIGMLAGIPVAFTAGVLLGGFARTAEIEELGAWLGTAERGRGQLGAALARTLGDPSLTLVFRTEDGWVDGDGNGADLPSGAAPVRVRLGDREVGAIGYDTTLLPDPDIVRTAGQVVAIEVDRERLTAQLLADQEQLRVSRTRLVEAGDRERRRLAQDLHDRLQGRLVLLAMRLSRLHGDDEDVAQARFDLDEVISELRLVVQGVMPALLIERGLAAAVEDLAERIPLRTVLDVGADDQEGRRLPPSVEGTAYHVVAEAMTNAVKHSGASELRIALHRRGGVLYLEVADDGTGGAEPGAGAGLRGIADRVDALGGRLRIDSPADQGTRLTVEIPCGS